MEKETNIMKERLRSFLQMDSCQKHYVGGFIPTIKNYIEGKEILSDEEIELSLIVLRFMSTGCAISTDFNLMKKEINVIIEQIERIKMLRKL